MDRHKITPSEIVTKPTGKYYVQTLGCQMNVHDSERIAGVLEETGLKPGTEAEAEAGLVDVFAINTCAVRENAANKLYGHLGRLIKLKKVNPFLQVAVGGCLAQKDRDEMVKRARNVDVVFGTHNLQGLPRLLEKSRAESKAQVEILPRLVEFPSNLAVHRSTPHSAWVSISMGCNNTCTFCIVPHLRGKERDRSSREILAEVEECVKNGAKEITLLGQNVNSYGSQFGDRGAFAKLLREMGQFESAGLKRVRFTSPHPASFTGDVIEAMAETSNVMPSLHMPLQSGSDRILRLMRRSYMSSKFLAILDKVRDAMPEAGITTDIIVGFPSETEDDFKETLRVVEEAQFSSAYTFQYSIRPGTPAATMPDQVSKDVVQERFERLIKLQNDITLRQQKLLEGKVLEVMVSGNTGRKDNQDHRISGYTKDARLVHFSSAHSSSNDSRIAKSEFSPGELVDVKITHAAPFHLLGETIE
ncbi:MAG: tRNA (N6-isopentenyl adenosine(37)-C2)-methylthiotransferase MiaB [Candidatus Ancillula sp.]|jgi:tRNA-2-methylthio-N6-dimethylallyladenosine synthase|nr:tRNA (N6-isopentenyl adenosine(37)-C2)-methylthiotransferase MiaB [Candidatus Ancillula sp.]